MKHCLFLLTLAVGLRADCIGVTQAQLDAAALSGNQPTSLFGYSQATPFNNVSIIPSFGGFMLCADPVFTPIPTGVGPQNPPAPPPTIPPPSTPPPSTPETPVTPTTPVPEINPGFMFSAGLLLTGTLYVMRRRT